MRWSSDRAQIILICLPSRKHRKSDSDA